MLYSEFKERQNRFSTALKIGAPFLGLIIIYISVFSIFEMEDNNFILLLLFIFVYIYYIFYMIYKGFQTSLVDRHTNAFNSYTIIEEIEKFIQKKSLKDGFVVMMNITNIFYVEEQYGIWTRNQVLKKFVEKLDTYLISHGFKNISIGRYQSGIFLLIFKDIKNKKYLNHILTGFCKEIKTDGIFKMEIETNKAIIEKTYDDKVKNIIAKLMNITNNIENDLQDILKPTELDILIRNAVNSQNFTFLYHALHNFTNHFELPKIFTVNVKLSIDNYGILPYSQFLYSVKKNGYEIKFDQLMLSALLKEIKVALSRYKDLKFVIKISAVSFRNRGFLIFLKELLKNMELDSSVIYFSLYENKIYDEFDRFKAIVNEYKELGFGIVFDHFGSFENTGVEYLKHNIKFDIVSFDLGFIKNIENKNYFQVLKSLADLAKIFGVKTLVKFVDKEFMMNTLSDFKPDFVQGFLFDKPIDIHEF
ncbi:MAG: EAL domain-containing protein [Campylobacteraceae bacterium]|jgi:EAL domain-containing protein (putative c-di-GMP-specific phosphodiesterase class I)/GGDEF domain-containing protein|nr:EAL domain-containing protein [Campylobacteraceae bacterium]